MDIDLRDYAAGGYFITKFADRAAYMQADLLPDRLLSLSSCINPGKVSVYWGWDIDQHRDEALAFGVPQDKLPEFVTWSQATGDVDYSHPDVFYTLEAAKEFIEAFLPNRGDLALIGIALPNPIVDGFLSDNKQYIYNSNRQAYEPALYGANYVLNEHKSLPPDGDILGFEVVSYNINLGCSWLCGGLERDMHREFGIRPGKYGLLETFEDANRVYQWILEGSAKGEHRGEPEPYYPWLIVRYPLA